MPPSVDAWTVQRLLEWCESYLTSKDIPQARLDAEILVAHVLGVERVHLITHPDEVVSEPLLAELRGLISRRAAREPVSRLLGQRGFFREQYQVTKDVLDPRPETEFLVEGALERVTSGQGLDVGTGSGCVAISLAANATDLQMLGVDVSEEALKVARRNARHNSVDERCRFELSNGFGSIEDGAYDLIVSNPPYIPSADIETLQPEVRLHDPQKALDGGADGLDFYRLWLPEIMRCLKTGGHAGLEVGQGQSRMVESLGLGVGLVHTQTVNDYASIPRIVWFEKRS